MGDSQQLFSWLVRQVLIDQQTPLMEGLPWLQGRQQELGLGNLEVDSIIREVLSPYPEYLQAYQAWYVARLHPYQQHDQPQDQQYLDLQFRQAIVQYLITPQLPLTESIFKTLRDCQQYLGLSDDRAIQVLEETLNQNLAKKREFQQVQKALFQRAATAFLLDRPLNIDGIRNLQITYPALFFSEQQAIELIRQVLLWHPMRWHQFQQLQQEEKQYRQLLYKKEQFRLCAEQSLIYQGLTLTGLNHLRTKQQELDLTELQVEQIINEILELDPAKRQVWEQVQKQDDFHHMVQELLIKQPITLTGISQVKGRQAQIGFTEAEADRLLQEWLAQSPGKLQEFERTLKAEQFCQATEQILQASLISIQTIAQVIDTLKDQQRILGLTTSEAIQLLDRVLRLNNNRYGQFRQLQQELFRQEIEYYINEQPVSQIRLDFFKDKGLSCLLTEQQANATIQDVIKTKATNRRVQEKFQEEYQQRLQTYDQIFDEIIHHGGMPLSSKAWEELHEWRLRLGLDKSFDIPDPTSIRTTKRINYTRLWRLLKDQNWQAACDETFHKMLEATHRQEQGFLSCRSIELFPCVDLCTIDHLWRKSSHGKFGFSVQYNIWQQCRYQPGHKPEHQQAGYGSISHFAACVGWRHAQADSWLTYESLNFSLDAPDGHLPAFPLIGWWCWMGGMKALFDRLEICPLNDAEDHLIVSQENLPTDAALSPLSFSMAINQHHATAAAVPVQPVANRSADSLPQNYRVVPPDNRLPTGYSLPDKCPTPD